MRRLVPGLVALAGYVLVLVGVVVFNLANTAGQPPYDFGWSAYSPLEETQAAYQSAITFTDRTTVLWTGAHLLGAGLVALGALVLAGVGGWLLGRRSGLRGSARG